MKSSDFLREKILTHNAFKRFFAAFLCCGLLLFAACSGRKNADGEISRSEIRPNDEFGRNTETASAEDIAAMLDAAPTSTLAATPTPPVGPASTLPPATKIDGAIYWSHSRGQSDRFRIKEENYLGEILYYTPGEVSMDSEDYSSEIFPVGVKVYRDAEDETMLWFVEYHEEDDYNEYSCGILQENLTRKPASVSMLPDE